MIDSSAARRTILSRIRGPHAPASPANAETSYAAIGQSYIRAGRLDSEQRMAMLKERLIEYDAGVYRVTEAALPEVMAATLRKRGVHNIAVPVGISAAWLPQSARFTEADQLSNLELDGYDGVVSGCTVAIALTGTVVLQSTAGIGPRKLSLVPDYHLCVVFAGQIVETVAEAFDRLLATAELPTTFISGPSATADIEMTRIKGVHGPRFLDVLIVG